MGERCILGAVEKDLVRDIIQWDVANWKHLLKIGAPVLQKFESGEAASFGEREGGLSLWLALNGFRAECSDYNLPKEIPFPLHVKREVVDLIHYSQQDITAISFEENRFDVVMFKSVIGALGDKQKQETAIAELYRVLKPGGYLIFAENTEASVFHRYARKKFTHWGHRWRYLPKAELPQMLNEFQFIELKHFGFFATFGRSEKQRTFLTFFDRIFVPIMPKKWRYFVVAVCRKPDEQPTSKA